MKRKRGQPKDALIAFRLPESKREVITAIACARGLTQSEVIREALDLWMATFVEVVKEANIEQHI